MNALRAIQSGTSQCQEVILAQWREVTLAPVDDRPKINA